jgi:hypothetical protein
MPAVFRILKGWSSDLRMETFIYRCPNTGRKVQGWLADDPTADDDTFEAVACLACSRVHLVNRIGTVLGAGQDES